MKQLAILSAAILSASFVAPLAGNASLPPQKTNDAAIDSAPVVKSTVADQGRSVFVITKTASTGTLIPTVYRIYRGRVTTSSSRSGATYADLTPAGSENVAGSLIRLDPAITLTTHR